MANVRVCCRFRPFNKIERKNSSVSCVVISEDRTGVAVCDAEGKKHDFTFDQVFGDDSTQEEVFAFTAKPVIEEVLEGFNSTIFAFGQTGSGKTFTMMGEDVVINEETGQTLKGIIPRCVFEVFEAIMNAEPHLEFTVRVSYIEIYMERIKDLMNPTESNLKLREEPGKGVKIEGVTEIYAVSFEHVMSIMMEGTLNRAVAATRMNEDSSRSHSVFIITVDQKDTVTSAAKSGKLYLVDLAGSEMVKKTLAKGQTLKEAQKINLSLSALGNVIMALTSKGNKHIPYRDSKLTRLLSDSLGGNSKTSLIITASLSSYNVEETISTLRFGFRAKSIKNKPKVNREMSVGEYKVALEALEQDCQRYLQVIGVLEEKLKLSGVDAASVVDMAITSPSPSRSASVTALRASESPLPATPMFEDEAVEITHTVASGAGITAAPSLVTVKVMDEGAADEAALDSLEAVLRSHARVGRYKVEIEATHAECLRLRDQLAESEAETAAFIRREEDLMRAGAEVREELSRLHVKAEETHVELETVRRTLKQVRFENEALRIELQPTAGASGLASSFELSSSLIREDAGKADSPTSVANGSFTLEARVRELELALGLEKSRAEKQVAALQSDMECLSLLYVETKMELVAERSRVDDLLGDKRSKEKSAAVYSDLKIQMEEQHKAVVSANKKAAALQAEIDKLQAKLKNRSEHLKFMEDTVQDIMVGSQATMRATAERNSSLEEELAKYKALLEMALAKSVQSTAAGMNLAVPLRRGSLRKMSLGSMASPTDGRVSGSPRGSPRGSLLKGLPEGLPIDETLDIPDIVLETSIS